MLNGLLLQSCLTARLEIEKEPTSEGKLTTKICRTNAYLYNPVSNLRNKDSAQRCIGDRETGR